MSAAGHMYQGTMIGITSPAARKVTFLTSAAIMPRCRQKQSISVLKYHGKVSPMLTGLSRVRYGGTTAACASTSSAAPHTALTRTAPTPTTRAPFAPSTSSAELIPGPARSCYRNRRAAASLCNRIAREPKLLLGAKRGRCTSPKPSYAAEGPRVARPRTPPLGNRSSCPADRACAAAVASLPRGRSPAQIGALGRLAQPPKGPDSTKPGGGRRRADPRASGAQGRIEITKGGAQLSRNQPCKAPRRDASRRSTPASRAPPQPGSARRRGRPPARAVAVGVATAILAGRGAGQRPDRGPPTLLAGWAGEMWMLRQQRPRSGRRWGRGSG